MAEAEDVTPGETLTRLISAAGGKSRPVRITVEFDDGRVVSADLPRDEAGGGPRLTPGECRVVDLFADLAVGERLKGVTIAKALGVQHGSIRKVLSALAKRGVLLSHAEGGYSRGPKYPEPDDD
jgi:hypothetical protein